MALSSFPDPTLIEDSSLTNWTVIGSGGFGQIFKARHQKWCCDVAVKLLHHDDGTSASLLREIKMMRKGSSPYVIQVLGLFNGRPPSSGPSTQLGLVMEFMERGSLATLQKTLCKTPPWPLVFRLAHQVAVGINFLHSLTPALLHLDLKPSNVLLDTYLNAKLTDFGLSRFYHSVTRSSRKKSEEEGGTISYMPPEAFNISYTPTKASDIYSFGILLWSIVTGKQPYANARSTMVRFRIPEGDRPSLDEIRSQDAGLAGLSALMNLMERCWKTERDQRPTSHNCATETEELYKMHKRAIHDAVHQVLTKMKEKEEESPLEQIQRIQITQPLVSTSDKATNLDSVPTGPAPIQEMAGAQAAIQSEKARVKDPPSSLKPATVCDVDLGRPSTSSSSSSVGSPQGRAVTSQQAFKQILMPQHHYLQRQCSSPDISPYRHFPVDRRLNIHLSNVTGYQHGNNNTLHIYTANPLERRRHPTAPSSINVSPSGSRRDKPGGVG